MTMPKVGLTYVILFIATDGHDFEITGTIAGVTNDEIRIALPREDEPVAAA